MFNGYQYGFLNFSLENKSNSDSSKVNDDLVFRESSLKFLTSFAKIEDEYFENHKNNEDWMFEFARCNISRKKKSVNIYFKNKKIRVWPQNSHL